MSFAKELDIIRLAELIRRLKSELLSKIELIEKIIEVIGPEAVDRVRYDGTTRTLAVRNDQLSIDDTIDGLLTLGLRNGAPPLLEGTPIDGQQAVTKDYVVGLIANLAIPLGSSTVHFTGAAYTFSPPQGQVFRSCILDFGSFVESPEAPYFSQGTIPKNIAGVNQPAGMAANYAVLRISQSGVYSVSAYMDEIIEANNGGRTEMVLWPETVVFSNTNTVLQPFVEDGLVLFDDRQYSNNQDRRLVGQFTKAVTITDAEIGGNWVQLVVGFRARFDGDNGWSSAQGQPSMRISSWVTRVGDVV
jgi:hypothetical protein